MSAAIIIDDHQLFAGGFSHLLKSIDVIDAVHCFNDPQSAFDHSSSDHIALVVSDLYVPGYDMYFWFGELRRQFPGAILLVISSSISRADRADSLGRSTGVWLDSQAD